jgi:hypothetical protein
MKTLKKIYRQILLEQNPSLQQTPQVPQTTTQPMQMATPQIATGNINKKILDFKDFTISVFPQDRKLLLTQKKGTIRPTKMRQLINSLKTNFNTVSIKDLLNGTFEVKFNPSENFGKVIDFVQRR